MGPEVSEQYTFIQLRNMGSTCYINAVLQALFATDIIPNFCYQYDAIHKKYPHLTEITNKTHLYLFVKIYIDSQNAPQNEVLYEPNYFLDSVFSPGSPFIRGEQADSHEFMMFLLNVFDDEISQINDIIEEHDRLPLFSSFFEGIVKTNFSPYPGLLFKSEMETFSYISIFRDSIELGIHDWLSCDDIQRFYRDMVVKREISEFPSLLVLHAPVFLSPHEKRKINMIPIQELSLSGKNYYLKAIVLHLGENISNGHYVCFYEINLRWVYADDECMRPLNHEEYHTLFGRGYLPSNHTATPYLLIYEQ